MSASNSTSSNLRDSVRQTKEIADGVVLISRTMKELATGKLNEKAILVLLAHETKMSQKAIKKVLDALGTMEELYVRPMKKEDKTQP